MVDSTQIRNSCTLSDQIFYVESLHVRSSPSLFDQIAALPPGDIAAIVICSFIGMCLLTYLFLLDPQGFCKACPYLVVLVIPFILLISLPLSLYHCIRKELFQINPESTVSRRGVVPYVPAIWAEASPIPIVSATKVQPTNNQEVLYL